MSEGEDSQSSGTETQRRIPWVEIVGRIGVAAVAHPFEYVKVLIQIGHEPIPPRPTHTLFGRPAMALPGGFRYMKHIKSVDGFFGLYRGLLPKLCANLVSGVTHSTVMQHLPFLDEPIDEEAELKLTDEEKIKRFLMKTIRETIARCLATIVSHPLHVLTVRSMAQFVGREEYYNGLFGALFHVPKEDGLRGFFAGLIPRLLGEVTTLWLAQVATFIINTYLVEEKTTQSYIGTSLLYISGALTYPFSLVSTVMAVNNCGLSAGLPPDARIYKNWTDCWAHLSAIGQLKRGSSLLWRYYSGPMESGIYSPYGHREHVKKIQ